jgi:hypothetical protein
MDADCDTKHPSARLLANVRCIIVLADDDAEMETMPIIASPDSTMKLS